MFTRTVAWGSLAILGASAAHAGTPLKVEPADMSQRLLDALREVSGVPGFSAAVWRDGQVVWSGTSGMRNVEQGLPVTTETRFRLASVSKLITATAAARLAEQGRLDLDAPVTSVLPWLDNDWPTMTARQLASHTSGLPHYQAVDESRGNTRYPDGRAAVGLFADRELLSTPAARYGYSSWGYTLLGAMIEEVSEKAFAEYVAEEITPHLDIGLDATDSGDPDVTQAYVFIDRVAQPAPSHDYSYTWGGGGMMASAPDLVRFGGAMLENRIVTQASFDDMTTPVQLASGEAAGEQGYQVGFGWRIANDLDGLPIAFHNGAAIGARPSLVLWRDEGTAVALLSNSVWTSSIDLTAQMLAAPFRDKPQGLIPTACPATTERFDGTLSDQKVSGVARFAIVDGICQGTLELAGNLQAYFDRGPQPAALKLRVISLDTDGGMSRAGLVTPFGIYDLRATGAGGFRSQFSTTRVLELRLSGSSGRS